MSISRSPRTHHDRTLVSIMINSYLKTQQLLKTDPLQFCYSSQPLPSVSCIYSEDIVSVLTLLLFRSPDLYFLPSQPPVHNCLLSDMFVMVMNTTLIFMLFDNCMVGLLFCFYIAVFKHECVLCWFVLSLAHHFSLLLWTGGGDGA